MVKRGLKPGSVRFSFAPQYPGGSLSPLQTPSEFSGKGRRLLLHTVANPFFHWLPMALGFLSCPMAGIPSDPGHSSCGVGAIGVSVRRRIGSHPHLTA